MTCVFLPFRFHLDYCVDSSRIEIKIMRAALRLRPAILEFLLRLEHRLHPRDLIRPWDNRRHHRHHPPFTRTMPIEADNLPLCTTLIATLAFQVRVSRRTSLPLLQRLMAHAHRRLYLFSGRRHLLPPTIPPIYPR